MEPILLSLMVFIFAVIILTLGYRLQKIKSLAKLINNFETSSHKNLFDAWFIGLSVPGQKTILKNIVATPKADKFITLFFRLSGWFFIILGLGGIIGSPFLLMAF